MIDRVLARCVRNCFSQRRVRRQHCAKLFRENPSETVSLQCRLQRGFLLIEVLVAIFIIGATIALYAAALRSFAVSRTSAHGEVALRIAEHELERLRAGGYAALPGSGSFASAQLSELSNATGTRTVSSFNAATKQVVVSVSWEEPATAATSTVSLTTLITQTGGL